MALIAVDDEDGGEQDFCQTYFFMAWSCRHAAHLLAVPSHMTWICLGWRGVSVDSSGISSHRTA